MCAKLCDKLPSRGVSAVKTKILFVAATAAVLVLVSASCSSGNGGGEESVPAASL